MNREERELNEIIEHGRAGFAGNGLASSAFGTQSCTPQTPNT